MRTIENGCFSLFQSLLSFKDALPSHLLEMFPHLGHPRGAAERQHEPCEALQGRSGQGERHEIAQATERPGVEVEMEAAAVHRGRFGDPEDRLEADPRPILDYGWFRLADKAPLRSDEAPGAHLRSQPSIGFVRNSTATRNTHVEPCHAPCDDVTLILGLSGAVPTTTFKVARGLSNAHHH